MIFPVTRWARGHECQSEINFTIGKLINRGRWPHRYTDLAHGSRGIGLIAHESIRGSIHPHQAYQTLYPAIPIARAMIRQMIIF